jgi:hypothetical protein
MVKFGRLYLLTIAVLLRTALTASCLHDGVKPIAPAQAFVREVPPGVTLMQKNRRVISCQ